MIFGSSISCMLFFPQQREQHSQFFEAHQTRPCYVICGSGQDSCDKLQPERLDQPYNEEDRRTHDQRMHQYVYQVFETLPYRFILKPVDKSVFQKALSDAMNYCTDRNKMFLFHIDRTQYQIPLQEIVYFESHLRRITLHTQKESYTFYGRLQDLTARLNHMFFVRTHTSYIVNMDYIRVVRETETELQNGEHIPVSRKYRASVRAEHLKYMKWRTMQ